MIDFEVTTIWGGGTVHLQPPRWWGQDLFNWSFIHLYLYQETPTNHFKFVGRGKKKRKKKEEYVARHLAQFTGEGEQGHVSPNTGAP